MVQGLLAAELIYEGNKVISASFHPQYWKLNNNIKYIFRKLERSKYGRTFRSCSRRGEKRQLFLLAAKKPTPPYRGRRLYSLYLKGTAYLCEKAVIRRKWRILPTWLHHTRSYKFEEKFSRRLYYQSFKYYTPDPDVVDHYFFLAKNAGSVPGYGIPLLIGLWTEFNEFDIYWYSSRYWMNRLARQHGLPEHTKSLFEHSPFVITTTHRPDGSLVKIKHYYRQGYTIDLFANQPHLVYNKLENEYYLMDLKEKRILQRLDRKTLKPAF